MKKILIIEDDMEIADVEKDYLELSGLSVTIRNDGLAGYQEALSNPYDLILLDLMLPGMDGFEICRKLREKLDIPITIVSARHEDIDKIRTLGFGADEYIEKHSLLPFSLPRSNPSFPDMNSSKAAGKRNIPVPSPWAASPWMNPPTPSP